MTPLSRRRFLAGGALAIPALVACGEGLVEPDETGNAVDVTAGEIRIRLGMVPSLAAVGGAFVVPQASVIVLRVAGGEYRAFSNICTHAGCGISQFIEMRLRCQCHGSEFDIEGRNVAGPAPTPLPRYPATLEEGGAVLRIALE